MTDASDCEFRGILRNFVSRHRFIAQPVVVRYIETNPLRAKLTADLAEYPWTSYAAHGLGREDGLLSAVPGWERLGPDEPARQAWWRQGLHEPLNAGRASGGGAAGDPRAGVSARPAARSPGPAAR